jgi:putative metalloprotease
VIGVPRIKVNIYEIEPINGLADADGRIFITRGFYRKFRSGEVSAEEMASVIAHEMGHVALGHAKQRAIDFSGQNALRTALAMMLSRFIPFIGGYIAAGLVSLLTARLSRNDEYEADAYATALLIKSGIGAGPQKTMFEKLEVMTGAAGSAMPAWLIGHPKPKQRIEAITKNEAKWS